MKTLLRIALLATYFFVVLAFSGCGAKQPKSVLSNEPKTNVTFQTASDTDFDPVVEMMFFDSKMQEPRSIMISFSGLNKVCARHGQKIKITPTPQSLLLECVAN